MLHHTNAFILWKTQTQDVLDFAVVACYAVPNLQRDLKQAEADNIEKVLIEPDHFNNAGESVSRLLQLSNDYQAKLSKYVLLSNFSFFESYVRRAFEEIVQFHGGKEQFPTRIRNRTVRAMSNTSQEMNVSKNKLQEYPKAGKELKYQKHAKILRANGYPFPSELFSSFGATQLMSEIRERNFKSHKIPRLLREAFLMDLSDADETEFTRIRNIRNSIAHGKPANLTWRNALEINRFLREFAIRIDKHLVGNFMLIEPALTDP